MSMFDPQSRNALAAFLVSEKERTPYSETYQRGLFAPLGVNGYTGQTEPAIPSLFGGGGWGTLHDIMQGRAVTKDEIDSAAMELGGAAQTGGMAMPKPRGALGSGAMREMPANSLMQGAKNEAQGIRAYHASPHDFDAFDFSKIGTGEGNQARGHGGYFSENPAVSGKDGAYYKQFEGSHGKAHAYEVNIKADPADFLDWDKPLSQQPQTVRSAVQDWQSLPMYANSRLGIKDPSAGGVVGAYGMAGRQEELANKLRDLGIPGIKYLDQGSRAAGDGSRNFVVFPGNEKLIEIARKYGIPLGALGLGASGLFDTKNEQ